MPHTVDREYYLQRAEAERALAEQSASPEIAALHRELAERYALLVRARKQVEGLPKLGISKR